MFFENREKNDFSIHSSPSSISILLKLALFHHIRSSTTEHVNSHEYSIQSLPFYPHKILFATGISFVVPSSSHAYNFSLVNPYEWAVISRFVARFISVKRVGGCISEQGGTRSHGHNSGISIVAAEGPRPVS